MPGFPLAIEIQAGRSSQRVESSKMNFKIVPRFIYELCVQQFEIGTWSCTRGHGFVCMWQNGIAGQMFVQSESSNLITFVSCGKHPYKNKWAALMKREGNRGLSNFRGKARM